MSARLAGGATLRGDPSTPVALNKSYVSCEGTPQSKALKEMLDQSDASELREADPIGSNSQVSRSAAHCCRTALLVQFSYKGQNSLPCYGCQGFRAYAKHFIAQDSG